MIGEFLKTRRRQLVRADFGLPPVARGSSGLRREEVAYLARVSITWYTRLEQGRAITPSRQVVVRGVRPHAPDVGTASDAGSRVPAQPSR